VVFYKKSSTTFTQYVERDLNKKVRVRTKDSIEPYGFKITLLQLRFLSPKYNVPKNAHNPN